MNDSLENKLESGDHVLMANTYGFELGIVQDFTAKTARIINLYQDPCDLCKGAQNEDCDACPYANLHIKVEAGKYCNELPIHTTVNNKKI